MSRQVRFKSFRRKFFGKVSQSSIRSGTHVFQQLPDAKKINSFCVAAAYSDRFLREMRRRRRCSTGDAEGISSKTLALGCTFHATTQR